MTELKIFLSEKKKKQCIEKGEKKVNKITAAQH